MGKKNTRTSAKTLSSREIEQELLENELYDEFLDMNDSEDESNKEYVLSYNATHS